MTVPDFGPERPHGQASETREMGERARTENRETDPAIGNRKFLIGFVLIVTAIVVFALLR